jgi:formate/nitrite transporter FocA (FNT family)
MAGAGHDRAEADSRHAAGTSGVTQDVALRGAFERTIDEGTVRLTRTWPSLVATGVVGGADVSLGVLALYLVRRATGSELLSALAFGVGFIALTLANSELFTENFLVPVAAVAARNASVPALLRLWLGTLIANLAGAWLVMGLIMAGFGKLGPVAIEVASTPASAALDDRTLANMVVAGAVITLMTWMERSTESVPAKLVSAVVAAFLLAAGPMDHAIVVSVEMFGALHAGAPFAYAHWLGFLGWSILGNMLGGLGLVTLLRLVQVGRRALEEERERQPLEERAED